MAKPTAPISSNQPDLKILAVLGVVHRILLPGIILFSSITFLSWIFGPVDRGSLPGFWHHMKVNNALMTLLCGVSIALTDPRRSQTAVTIGRVVAGLEILLSATFVYERIRNISLPLDTFFAADPISPHPGRVSIEACTSFLLIGLVLLNLRSRKSWTSRITDVLTLASILMFLMFSARYAFGASLIFGPSVTNPLSIQTFTCLGALTWLVVIRRADYGILALLVGGQIGGKTVRLATPFAILLPFVIALSRVALVRRGIASEATASSASTAIFAVLAFCLVLALGAKNDHLEDAIRELSLRDELTRLYNRRGFYFLAEQALRLTQRAGSPFFVLFVDMDNLKIINDTLGHEVGSERLQQLANILEQTFRETDVIGRLGGDEFVVAGRADLIDLGIATRRLEEVAATLNAGDGDAFPITFSLGYVISEPDSRDSLETLIERADTIMYQAKRDKKRSATSTPA
jgi:diguanylate cyclase (GGDEF)-like protein